MQQTEWLWRMVADWRRCAWVAVSVVQLSWLVRYRESEEAARDLRREADVVRWHKCTVERLQRRHEEQVRMGGRWNQTRLGRRRAHVVEQGRGGDGVS